MCTCAATVTAQVALLLPMVAEIVAVPAAFGVTMAVLALLGSASTVATLAALDDQLISWFSVLFSTVAVKVPAAPFSVKASVVGANDIVSSAAGALVTVTVQDTLVVSGS